MNLLKIFTKIISFFNWNASGWYPIVIDQFDKMRLISYGQFDFTYDIKEGNVFGFKIPYMCDKIRFNCSSNVSFTATTFKNYSSENCESSFTHYKLIPEMSNFEIYPISYYLNEGDIWEVNIESKFEISIFNISINDYYKYIFNKDYLREIVSMNGFQNTNSYTNKWIVESSGSYVILLKKFTNYERNQVNISYKLNSNSQCLKKNNHIYAACFNDGEMSENISYPDGSVGILINMNNFDKNIYNEKFECIIDNSEIL